MRDMRRANLALAFVITGAVLFFSALIFYTVQDAKTAAFCLKHGYPSSNMTFGLDKYCIKRVDQTDVVVPIDEVQEARK
jgi:hypothetical protein